jgi:hypothetical protein
MDSLLKERSQLLAEKKEEPKKEEPKKDEKAAATDSKKAEDLMSPPAEPKPDNKN